MALKKPTFEQEPTDNTSADVAAVETPKVAAPVAEAKAPDAETPEVLTTSAKVTSTVAIAAASGSAVAAQDAANKAKDFQREFNAMKGASDFAYGNYLTFKGSNGELQEMGGGEGSLGRWAKVRLISWDDHTEISPGEQAASTKDFVAYSKDGKTVDSVIGEDNRGWVGKPVGEYLEFLRTTEGFAAAKARRFVDLGCALLGTDNGDGPIGKVIQVTLSESSIPSFSRYNQELADTARCIAMGIPGFKLPEDPFSLYIIRELASKGTMKWTKLKISSTLPTKL